ncbi:MAG: AHH domain-containing protein, partial [Candidatus Paracaedibacteraceae bacterium]|nr:AHH domain-containing protein [Candidatus Paracaedibacteraceae bacterium]
ETGNPLSFFEREMPIIDDACGFYSLDLKGRDESSVRQEGTRLLLAHARDAEIRNILAFEITDKTMQGLLNSDLSEANQLYQRLKAAKQALDAAVRVVNLSKGTNLTAQKLLELDPNERDRDLIPVQLKLEALDTVKSDIRAWAALEKTYRTYVENHISKPGVRLECDPDFDLEKKTPGSMDALAKILGINLKVYVKDAENQGRLKLVHTFNGGDKPINIVHVAYDPNEPHHLNHYNRLEETQDFTKATHQTEEHFPEENSVVETKSGYDILLPFAAVGTFAANVRDGVKWLEAQHNLNVQETKQQLQRTLEASGINATEANQTVTDVEDVVDKALETQAAVNKIAKSANKQLKANKRTKTKDGSDYLGASGSLDAATNLHKAPTQSDAEIAFEAAAAQLELLDNKVEQLDQRLATESLTDKARDIIISVKEVLVEQAHDIRQNWQSYGLVAAEALPFGVGTGVTVGREGYVVYQGAKTVGGAVGTLAVEGAMGYVGGKAIKLVGRGVGKLSSKIVEKVAEKRAARSTVHTLNLAQSKAALNNKHLFQKHHVISDKHTATKDHRLWDAAGMNPNDPRNLMSLPTVEGAKLGTNTRSIHQGRHLGEVNEALEKKMMFAFNQGKAQKWVQPQYADALTGIINAEKQVLKNGDRALNKHARPHAKRIIKMEN